MFRLSLLAAAGVMVLAGPAQAGRCIQPYAPVIKASAAATPQDMKTLRADVASFIAASDLYQTCLVAQNSEQAKLDANQAEKERIGRQFNALVQAYAASHRG
jgi:septal ring factor EnvC (AmiA/AmiB activator)